MSNKKQFKPSDTDAAQALGVTAAAEGGAGGERNDENAALPVDSDQVAEDSGKFSSSKALLDAYNALQSEFTKRCQLIKQLQARLDECRAQAISGEALEPARLSAVRSSAHDGEARLAEAIAVIAENIDDCADYLATLPQIADAVILTYKKKLLSSASAAAPRGMAVVMPARRPKTLEEAKRLADEMLKSN